MQPLIAGESLDLEEFHNRYRSWMPEAGAELIDGIVRVPSPICRDHIGFNRTVSMWLGHYERFTPRTWGTDRPRVILGESCEVEPDAVLLIMPEFGGQCHLDSEGSIVGAPELVLEIARSSRNVDLGAKKECYRRAGVREYIVISLEPEEVFWFIRRNDQLWKIAPRVDGLFHSDVFVGLRLDHAAMLCGDMDCVIGELDRGIQSLEHAAFVDGLSVL